MKSQTRFAAIRLAVIGYFVVIHALFAVVLCSTSVGVTWLRKLGLAAKPRLEQDSDRVTVAYRNRFKRTDPFLPPNVTILIGDSQIERICAEAVNPFAVNYGIAGETTEEVLERIKSYESIKQAKHVVLEVGVNDLKTRSNEEILETYREIVATIPAQCVLTVLSIFPVREPMNEALSGYNERIRDLNDGIRDICSARKGCEFVDAHRLLADVNGELQGDFDIGDGVHLSNAGRLRVIEGLKATE